jgi:hypothetical protein
MTKITKKYIGGRLYEISDGKLNFVQDKSLVSNIVKKYEGNFPKVYGIPRSGSTLIRNILNTIFDGNIYVQKHDFFNAKCKIVCVYRDFRDSAASKWRINTAGFDKPEDKIIVGFADMHHHAKRIHHQVNTLNKFKEHYTSDQVYFARYESYINDYDVLFDDLETFFDIEIKERLRKFIKDIWSKERVKKTYSDALGKFVGFDKNTELHGQHIYKGEVGTWKEFLTEKGQREITKFFENDLNTWGYEL